MGYTFTTNEGCRQFELLETIHGIIRINIITGDTYRLILNDIVDEKPYWDLVLEGEEEGEEDV